MKLRRKILKRIKQYVGKEGYFLKITFLFERNGPTFNVGGAFSWGCTSEGVLYWDDISEKYNLKKDLL